MFNRVGFVCATTGVEVRIIRGINRDVAQYPNKVEAR